MGLQISIFGIAIAAIFYTVGALILVTLKRLLRSNRWRQLVIAPLTVLVVAAPWADELWIAWHFSALCKDAGVHIVRSVEVEGFLNDTTRSSSEHLIGRLITDAESVTSFDRSGYRFKESRLKDGKVWRLERVAEGVQTSVIDKPTARYHYTITRYHQDAGYQLEAIEYAVVDSQTGEVIGRKATYKRYPGWVNAIWIRYFGSGMTMCPDPERGPRQLRFPESVLMPIKTK